MLRIESIFHPALLSSTVARLWGTPHQGKACDSAVLASVTPED